MTIEPIADIIIYTDEAGSRAFRLLGGTQAGLDYLKARYGSLAHGTMAAISGTDEYLNAEFAAIDAVALQSRMWC